MSESAASQVSKRLKAIEKSLARGKGELPALVPLLDAIGPIIKVQAELYDTAPGWSGPAPSIDPERFAQGAFLLEDVDFEDMSSQLPAAVAALLPVMKNSFPALAEELEAMDAALASGALPAQTLAAAAFGEDVPTAGISGATLSFVARELVRPFIRRQAVDLMQMVRELPWGQTFCPVCGSAPDMSVLRRVEEDNEFLKSHGGKRFLHCSCCATEWAYKRVSCPACGCEEPDELAILRDPDREHERADACNSCKSFVLCLDTGELAETPDPDVAAITMLPLEYKTREQGYTPMARHPWSGL